MSGSCKTLSSTHSLFPLGRIVATPGAIKALEDAGDSAFKLLDRHRNGDWGAVCGEDGKENDLAIREGHRILSSYRTSLGTKVWVITEADRSTTTLLLPEDY